MRVVLVLGAIAALAFAATAAAMTRSQAKAVVRDVNLKASDLPGYDNVPSDPPTAQDRQAETRLARCYGGVAPARALATGSSPVFIRGSSDNFDLFGSIVTVFPKATLVRRDLKALRSPRARECYRAEVERAAGASGNATVTVTVLQTAVRGVFGYRFQTQVGTGQSLYSDFFFMATRSGEARVIVNASPTAPAQSLDDRVVRIVRTRLDARLNPDTVL
jgi:hypothetical protein